MGEVPEIKGAIMGVPIMRIVVFWGLYFPGSAILGNYHDCQRNTTLLDVTLAPSQHACRLLVARLFFP